MSIAKIRNLSKSIGAVLIHCPSASMQLYLKRIIKEHFGVLRDYNIDIMNKARLKDSKIEGLNRPLFCDKWVYHVDAELFKGKTDLTEGFEQISPNAVTIYWTTEYRTYMNLQKQAVFKQQPLLYQAYSFSRFEDNDLMYLINSELDDEDDKILSKKLKKFVNQNYRYEVQSVFDLIANIASGQDYNSDRDIIKSIGLGGNSADTLVIFLLAKDFTTDKQVINTYKDFVMRMDDLYEELAPRTLRNFMLNAVNTIIEMKQLELMGVLDKFGRDIPEGFNEKKINRFKRFKRIVLEDITLAKALLLRQQFFTYKDFDSTITNLQVISGYLNLYHTIPPKERKSKKETEDKAKEIEYARLEETLQTMQESRILAKKATAERFGLEMDGDDFARIPVQPNKEEETNKTKQLSALEQLMLESDSLDDSLFTKVKTPQEQFDEYRAMQEERENIKKEEKDIKAKKGTVWDKEIPGTAKQLMDKQLDNYTTGLNENQMKLVSIILDKHDAEGELNLTSDGDIVDGNGIRLTKLSETEKKILTKHIKHKQKEERIEARKSGKVSKLKTDGRMEEIKRVLKAKKEENRNNLMDEEGVKPKFIEDTE